MVTGALQLPTLPEVYFRLIQLLDDPRSRAADIGRLIEADPGLSARLLKVVNSAFYGFASSIASIQQAATVIGSRDLHHLVLATAVVECFAGLSNDLVSMFTFWSHSVRCAIAARDLAACVRPRLEPQEMFVAGLLHDIGSLVIYNRVPELARAAFLRVSQQEVGLFQAERAIMGFDHADVGREIVAAWGLPDLLRETTGLHHAPERAQHFPVQVWLVHIANAIARTEEPTVERVLAAVPAGSPAWESTGLEPEVLTKTLAELERQFADVMAFVWA